MPWKAQEPLENLHRTIRNHKNLKKPLEIYPMEFQVIVLRNYKKSYGALMNLENL